MKEKLELDHFEALAIEDYKLQDLKGGDDEVTTTNEDTEAIIFLGIGAFFGKVNWGLALTVSVGIIASTSNP